MAYYADTSALVKLVVSEPESDALRAWIGESDRGLVSCDLARTELMRAARRALPGQMLLVRAVLDSITLTRVSTATFDEAGRLDPRSYGRPTRFTSLPRSSLVTTSPE